MSGAGPDVLVVGAGITGVACARALEAAAVGVRVLERSGRPGGRLASPPLHDRPVDLGAAYFTVADDDAPASADFAEQVADWTDRGLAVPWTSTMRARAEDGTWSSKDGPTRWSAPGGLRSLVTDLAADLRVETRRTVSAVVLDPERGPALALDPGSWAGGDRAPKPTMDPARAVVLAMPDPQAARLLPPSLAAATVADRPWDPVIAVALGYARRCWDPLPAAFVNSHFDVALLADDGSRRGDDAPVLVAHTTGDLARRHLDAPDGAVGPVVEAVTELLGLTERPEWTHVHRWTFASPAEPHDTPFFLDADLVGVAGDAWGSPKVETAWRSGTLLGRALAARLGA